MRRRRSWGIKGFWSLVRDAVEEEAGFAGERAARQEEEAFGFACQGLLTRAPGDDRSDPLP